MSTVFEASYTELLRMKDQIERLTAERDRLDKQLIGWMNAFADMSIERDQLRAALGEITQVAWAALNSALAEGTPE